MMRLQMPMPIPTHLIPRIYLRRMTAGRHGPGARTAGPGRRPRLLAPFLAQHPPSKRIQILTAGQAWLPKQDVKSIRYRPSHGSNLQEAQTFFLLKCDFCVFLGGPELSKFCLKFHIDLNCSLVHYCDGNLPDIS